MKEGDGKKLLFGLIAVFILFQWVASYTESTRGEAGVLVGLIVVIATLKIERLLFTKPVSRAARALGLAWPKWLGVIVALKIAALMLLSVWIFAEVTRSTFTMYPNWEALMVGLFFQAGIGEETLFRGYLFGHLRQQHTSGKAVLFAAIPFVLVHLILFYSLPWSLAGASILLAIAMSFPLSRLFEMSGDTIWGPAIVHFAAQAMAKMFVAEGERAWLFPFFVISASAVFPLIVYAVPFVMDFLRRRELVPVALATLVVVISVASVSAQSDTCTTPPAEPAPLLRQGGESRSFSPPCLRRGGITDEIGDAGVVTPTRRAADFWSQPELTGDWSDLRNELRRKGIDLKFRLTQGYQVVVDGNGGYSGKLDTHFRIDMEKLVGWKGLTVQIKTETRFGRLITAGNGVPVNAAVLSPKSSGAAFSVTALNLTQLIPIDEEKKSFIAVGAGKYYSLDSSREPFTGGAGETRFMNIMANGNPAVGQTVPIVSNGATFAWIRKGTPIVSFAVFDPVSSSTKIGVRRLFRHGVTLVPGFSIPVTIAGRTGRHSFSGTVTTRKFTPFDQLAQFIIPGHPSTRVVPKSGSWSATYTFNQYIQQRKSGDGPTSGWGVFGTFTAADQTTNPVSRFAIVGVGGNGLFKNRRADRFGVSYGFAGVSKKLQKVIDPVFRVRDENVGEAFYDFVLTPSVSFTGDLQVIRPASQSSNVRIVPGARLRVEF